MPNRADERALAYARQGFLIHDTPILSDAEVSRTVAAMEAVKRGEYDTGRPPESGPWIPGDDGPKLCKIEMPQLASRDIKSAVSHPALGELAAAITGAEMVQVWWVQLLIKPPADPSGAVSSNVGWHQDRQYWDAWEPESELFTAWLALSNVQSDCGPMRFVEGSHRWGFLGQGDFFGQSLEEQKQEFVLPDDTEWREETAILPPGGVSFHHNLTLHASGPNHASAPRRSLAIHLRTEKSRPRNDNREGLVAYLNDLDCCPVIWRR